MPVRCPMNEAAFALCHNRFSTRASQWLLNMYPLFEDAEPRTSPQAASIGLSSRPSRDGMVCVRACLIQAGDSRIHSWLRSVVFIAVASLAGCFDTNRWVDHSSPFLA